MAIYMNMDAKLRRGGRKAPKMSEEQLRLLLDAYFPKCEDDEYRVGMNMRLYDVIESDCTLISKAINDLCKVDASFENVEFVDFRMGNNGVPYLWFYFGGDWEIPVYAMLYFDGSNIRGYLPTKGNTFNRRCKAAFGSEESDLGPFVFEVDGQPETITFNSEDEKNKFLYDNYCASEGVGNVCESACNEDFSTRVIAGPELTEAQFQRALEKAKRCGIEAYEEVYG